MTLSYTGNTGTGSADASLATIAATFASNNVAGALLIAHIGWVDATGTLNVNSLTDSGVTNNWFSVAAKVRNTTQQYSTQLWYSFGVRAKANTVTANFSAATTFRRIGVDEVTSSLGSFWRNPLDQTNGGTGSSNAPNAGNVTPSRNNELVVACAAITNGTLGAGAGGYALRTIPSVNVAMEGVIQTTATTVAGVFTNTAVDNWCAQVATFMDVEPPPQYRRIPPPIIIYLAGWSQNRRSTNEDVGPPTNASAEVAVDIAFAANAATTTIAPTAQAAAVGFTANNASVAITPAAESAALTFVANDAQATVQPSSQAAAVVFTANNPSATITPQAGNATVVFTANNTSARVSPHADVANVTFAANNAQDTIAPHAGVATVSFTANNATVTTSVSALAEVATIGFVGNDVDERVSPTAGSAAVTFTANNATISTATVTNAPAGSSAISFVGNNATTQVSSSSGIATFTFQAFDATVVISGSGSALAQDAPLTFTAYNAHMLQPIGDSVEQWSLSL